jgi:hypothetical protein
MSRNRPGRTKYNEIGEEPFVCGHCGRAVIPTENGTRHRNHCPHCLWSRHMDRTPGDRLSSCRGLMPPVAVWMRQGEWVLLHRCERCTTIRANRIGPDDDLPTMLALAAGPLANPPIPTAEEIQI